MLQHIQKPLPLEGLKKYQGHSAIDMTLTSTESNANLSNNTLG